MPAQSPADQEISGKRHDRRRERHRHDDGDEPERLAGIGDGGLDHVPLASAGAHDLQEGGEEISVLHTVLYG
jgi:hypothetical protein